MLMATGIFLLVIAALAMLFVAAQQTDETKNRELLARIDELEKQLKLRDEQKLEELRKELLIILAHSPVKDDFGWDSHSNIRAKLTVLDEELFNKILQEGARKRWLHFDAIMSLHLNNEGHFMHSYVPQKKIKRRRK